MQYVAYYRVSTQQQGRSGLGLDAQRTDITRFVRDGILIAEYTDIESGKKDDRPNLLLAIDKCLELDATLVIAKLDRLSRDVEFIARLMKTKVKFVCCDMPDATPLTIHIFASIAMQEREMISARTKSALAEAKKRGTKLGNPQADKGFMDKIRDMRKPKKYNDTIMFIINQLQPTHSYQQIADELNKQKFTTFHGKPYRATTVFRMFKSVEHLSKHETV